MSAIKRSLSTPVPQTAPLDNRQVKNNAGGFVYATSAKARLERILILGTDGGTYYVQEKNLTDSAISFIKAQIVSDPDMVIDVTREVSTSGRSYRNDAAIFACAAFICLCSDEYKQRAKALINDVVRTSRHLFTFCDYIELLGGWGQAKMDAVRRWYESKSPDQLKYQAVKYRGSQGKWTHRDVLRTVHPKTIDPRTRDFMLNKPQFANLDGHGDLLDGFLLMQSAKRLGDVLDALSRYPNLPWETIPTQFLKEPLVWKQLFWNGQLKGINGVRNVRRLHENGAFKGLGFAAEFAASISDPKVIKAARIHPIQYLNAMGAVGILGSTSSVPFAPGRSSLTNRLTGPVADGLEAGFYASFGSLDVDTDRTMIAIDVSASMGWSGPHGMNFTCAQGAAAMAMVTARTIPAYQIVGFSTGLRDLGVSAKTDLRQAFQAVQMNTFGGTDCAAPMTHALNHSIAIDKFVVYTDNETYYGRVHPMDALRMYRNKTGINAKLIVVGMAGTQFTIADPNDMLSLDVVGFDTNTPGLIQGFGK